jgi:prevent-host-death family protein
MHLEKDVKPVAYMQNSALELLQQVNESHRPVVITVNGEAKAVVLDVDSYEALRSAPGEIDALAAERADLLVRRFSGHDLPKRDEERLAAVTARLEELLPAVTADDFEELEKIALRTQEISERTTARQQRFGLEG